MSNIEEKFKDMVTVKIDDLPKDVIKEINNQCTRIMMAATLNEQEQTVEPNICIGALQKAVALIVSKFFDEKYHQVIINDFIKTLKLNVSEWKDDR